MSKFRAKWIENGIPNNEYRLLVYVFEKEFPNFIRRAQKITEIHIERVKEKMNLFTANNYNNGQIEMQLKFAFGEYLTSSESMLEGYKEHDMRLIEIYS